MNVGGIIELLVTLPTGIAFIIIGCQLLYRQKISLIHEYQHKNVHSEDVKAYTGLWGISLVIMGICTSLTGVVDFAFYTETGWVIFVLGFIVGFIIGNKAQKKYNGSWFG